MIKKLTRHGNSLALVIDRAILDLLEIKEHRESFEQALEDTNKKYGKMLKRLGK